MPVRLYDAGVPCGFPSPAQDYLEQRLSLDDICIRHPERTLYTILCKCLFSEVTVQAVTELDNKAAHCHTPVPQRHRPFL